MVIKMVFLEIFTFACLYTDLKNNKIPNKFTFSFLIMGLILNLINGTIISSVMGMGYCLFMFLILYSIKSIAAGDVKFMAAVGAIMGIDFSTSAVLLVTIVGMVFSFVILIKKKYLKKVLLRTLTEIKQRFLFFIFTKKIPLQELQFDTTTQLPYMPAIAIGINLTLIFNLCFGGYLI